MKDSNKRGNVPTNSRKRGSQNKSRMQASGRNADKCYKSDAAVQVEDRSFKSSTDNDISWYWKNPILASNASNLYYNVRKGNELLISADATNPKVVTSISAPVNAGSGLFILEWEPFISKAYGIDTGSSTATYFDASGDACNVAAKNIYSFVRHANSGAANYEAPDLMMTVLAADSIFAMIADAIRAYGLARTYEQQNAMLPDQLLKSLGWDPDSFVGNLANFAYEINRVIAKASVIWVPGDLDIIKRHYWMNTNVYTDVDNVKGELYAFKMGHFWQFSARTESTGTSLSRIEYHGSKNSVSDLMTVQQWSGLVNTALNQLIEDEDAGIMFGDLRKAYGPDKLYSMQEMDVNYSIIPVYNEEVLTQISNSTAIPNLRPAKVVQKDGNIFTMFNKALPTAGNAIPYDSYPINMRTVDPSPEMTMIATRLTQIPGYVTVGTDPVTIPYAVGTELVTAYHVYLKYNGAWVEQPSITSNFVTSPENLVLAAYFDWAPPLFYGTFTEASGSNPATFTIRRIMCEFNNVGFVSAKGLRSMHDVAALSEFNVPQMN